MGDLRGELVKKARRPKQREVWLVRDTRVVLDDQERKDKSSRPVLVACSDMVSASSASINIIPLSASAKTDLLNFPLAAKYEEQVTDYLFSKSSHALLQLYQPIHLDHFERPVVTLTSDAYFAILDILIANVIGYPNFDLSIT